MNELSIRIQTPDTVVSIAQECESDVFIDDIAGLLRRAVSALGFHPNTVDSIFWDEDRATEFAKEIRAEIEAEKGEDNA